VNRRPDTEKLRGLRLSVAPEINGLTERYGDGEAVFNLLDEIVLRESVGLKVKELSKAQRLIAEHRALIERKWHEHFA